MIAVVDYFLLLENFYLHMDDISMALMSLTKTQIQG